MQFIPSMCAIKQFITFAIIYFIISGIDNLNNLICSFFFLNRSQQKEFVVWIWGEGVEKLMSEKC